MKHQVNFDPLHDVGNAPSPCIGICKMDTATGLCEGCHRTIAEIAGWSRASESEKRAIWVEIRRRQDALFE
jgi:predicted Fe-S protein YdhL (DUF1289 family)